VLSGFGLLYKETSENPQKYFAGMNASFYREDENK
jgi:hypothetical protein